MIPTLSVSSAMVLAPLELRHVEELFRLTDSNREHLRRWLPWLDTIRRVEDTRAFVRASQTQAAQDNGCQMGILLEGRIVGIIGHHGIDWRNRSTSLGYWLAAPYQGRGLVTDACRRLIRHAFDEAGLHRVEIRCAEGNLRSRAIPERLGFRQEGILREAEWLYDGFVDHVVYGLLASEWQP
jgi:ribosomal-protein-serine acetyltransferase